MPIKLLLADRHMLMLEGLRRALASAEDVEVVGETTSGRRVLPLVGQLQPDMLMVDMRMPQLDGIAILEEVKRQFPKVKVIVTAAVVEPEQIQVALRRGADAFIIKTINPADLPSAIRQAAEGTVFHALGVLDPANSAAIAAGLTERQIAILRGVARGLSNEAIARELWVTEQTVKYHLTNIYRKLGVVNRTEAVRYAFKHGLVERPPPEFQ